MFTCVFISLSWLSCSQSSDVQMFPDQLNQSVSGPKCSVTCCFCSPSHLSFNKPDFLHKKKIKKDEKKYFLWQTMNNPLLFLHLNSQFFWMKSEWCALVWLIVFAFSSVSGRHWLEMRQLMQNCFIGTGLKRDWVASNLIACLWALVNQRQCSEAFSVRKLFYWY